MRLPSLPKKGMAIDEWMRSVVDYLRATRTVKVVNGRLVETPSGTTIIVSPQVSGTRGGGSGPCAFGKLIATDTPGIMEIVGGTLYAGDKNFTVAARPVNLATDVDLLIYIELTVTVNLDDDSTILLPGVETTTDTPEWMSITYVPASDTDYPANTNPTLATGEGTIRIPIGRLTVAEGAAEFSPEGCGNITVTHCAGILAHTRA